MKRIGIYGGSFSPVHIGHVAAALAFKRKVALDKLIIIPASVPPHKVLSDGTDSEKRLDMCRIAFEGYEGIEVSDMELRREGKSYTYDTVKELYSDECELYMLCGTDMLITFDRWYRFQDILSMITLVYIRREDERSLDAEVERACRNLCEDHGARMISISVDEESAALCGLNGAGSNIGISSTMVRDIIAKREDPTKYLPQGVYEYILRNRLYGSEPDEPITEDSLDELRARSGEMSSPKRFAHVLGVERMAARLGELYLPEKINELRAAALLHDITKEYSLEKHLQIYQNCGIMSYEADTRMPKTMHAKTAAAIIPQLFPFCNRDLIVSSVRWHTTGRADMSIPEKLIYLADYIDDTRTFPDCVRLREYFFSACPEKMTEDERLEHLDRTLLLSFEMTVACIREEGGVIDGDTLAAIEYLNKK